MKLIDVLGRVWRDLRTPEDFKNDWYGYASNQLAHVTIGVLCYLAPALFLLPLKAMLVGLIAPLLKELADRHRGAGFVDSRDDVLFMSLGVAAAYLLAQGSPASVLALIGIGAWRLFRGVSRRLQ